MKSISEFKGYQTQVQYNAETKGFEQIRVNVPFASIEERTAKDQREEPSRSARPRKRGQVDPT